jgi:hypothetical protein
MPTWRSSALVEGDATLLMEQFSLGSVSLLDQLGAAMSPDAAAAQQQLDGAPSYLRNQLMFPYLSGLSYVCRFTPRVAGRRSTRPTGTCPRRRPSSSTRTGRGGAKDRVRSRSPGIGWTRHRRTPSRARSSVAVPRLPAGDEGKAVGDAAKAAQHWAGGDLTCSRPARGPHSALALVDTADGGTLCQAVGDWYAAAFSADVDHAGRQPR